jgi:hypothetical protein
LNEASEGLQLPSDFNFDLVNTGIRRTPKDQIDDMMIMNKDFPGKNFNDVIDILLIKDNEKKSTAY